MTEVPPEELRASRICCVHNCALVWGVIQHLQKNCFVFSIFNFESNNVRNILSSIKIYIYVLRNTLRLNSATIPFRLNLIQNSKAVVSLSTLNSILAKATLRIRGLLRSYKTRHGMKECTIQFIFHLVGPCFDILRDSGLYSGLVTIYGFAENILFYCFKHKFLSV